MLTNQTDYPGLNMSTDKHKLYIFVELPISISTNFLPRGRRGMLHTSVKWCAIAHYMQCATELLHKCTTLKTLTQNTRIFILFAEALCAIAHHCTLVCNIPLLSLDIFNCRTKYIKVMADYTFTQVYSLDTIQPLKSYFSIIILIIHLFLG